MFNVQELLDVQSLTMTLNHFHDFRVNVRYVGDDRYEVWTGNFRHGEELRKAIRATLNYLDVYRTIDIADPDVGTFIQLVQDIDNPRLEHRYHADRAAAERICCDINQVIALYQRKRRMNAKIKSDRKRMEARNSRSLAEYCDNLFDAHSRLLVVRVDLGYTKDRYDFLTTPEVIQDRIKYLKKVSRKFDGLVGYAWGMEYGWKRRYHFHMVFMFNGAVHRSDVRLGNQLGELWKDTCHTDGTYFNCNADKARYRDSCYLGMVDYYDEYKRQVMKDKVTYLCKLDDYVTALIKKNQRCFGRMESPTRRSRAGRPRIRHTRLADLD